MLPEEPPLGWFKFLKKSRSSLTKGQPEVDRQLALTGLVKRELPTNLEVVATFFKFIPRYTVSRILLLASLVVRLSGKALILRQLLREYLLLKLVSRRGYLFRPTSHLSVLALAIVVLVTGGAGSNIIWGRAWCRVSVTRKRAKRWSAKQLPPKRKSPRDEFRNWRALTPSARGKQFPKLGKIPS